MSGIRTVIVTALITAVAAGGITMYAYPRFANLQARDQQTAPLQPAVYNASQPDSYAPAYSQSAQRPRLRRAVYSQSAYAQPAYSAPVHRGRSTRNSVLIVAGSAGTGAAIGALAGGGKGAAIGALAGGVGGFVYDRLTHNK